MPKPDLIVLQKRENLFGYAMVDNMDQSKESVEASIVFSDWKLVNVQGILDLSKIFRSDFKFIEDSQRIFITFKSKKNLLEYLVNALKSLTPH